MSKQCPGRDANSKGRTAVTNGRVTKSTPSKKTKTKVVKQEEDEGNEEDIFHGLDFGDGNRDVDMDGDELAF